MAHTLISEMDGSSGGRHEAHTNDLGGTVRVCRTPGHRARKSKPTSDITCVELALFSLAYISPEENGMKLSSFGPSFDISLGHIIYSLRVF